MKQKDLALIIVIVFISVIVSLIVSNLTIGSTKNRQQQATIVQPITSDFPQPDKHYFNENAFDPTQTITIGQNANTDPFNTKQ